MSLLRIIASTKTTIFLILLLALSALLSLLGPQHSPSLLKSLNFHKGLLSWPFLVLLDLLLINQLGAIIVRLRQSRTRKNDPFFIFTPEEEEEEETILDEDWGVDITPPKKKGKKLPHPAHMSKQAGLIETLLPSSNAQALLQTLGFRTLETDDNDPSAERIVAQKGPSSWLYTTSLHLGVLCLIVGFAMLVAVMPSRTVTLSPGKKSSLGGQHETLWKTSLNAIGLSAKKQSESPKVDVVLRSVSRRYTTPTFVKQPAERTKRFEGALQRLMFSPAAWAKAPVASSNIPQLAYMSVSIDVQGKKKLKTLRIRQGNSAKAGPYRLTLSAPNTQVTLTPAQGKPVVLDAKARHKADGVLYRVARVYQPDPTAKSSIPACVFVIGVKAKKSIPPKCTPIGGKLKMGKVEYTVSKVEHGIELRYQRREPFTFIWLGLLLFLFGFIGFWWPARYQLFMIWRRGKNEIEIRGTGLDVAPKDMVRGIEQTLYFPPEWLGAPAKKNPQPAPPPRSSGNSPSSLTPQRQTGQAPPPPRSQTSPGPTPQAQLSPQSTARATGSAPLPPVPAPPQQKASAPQAPAAQRAPQQKAPPAPKQTAPSPTPAPPARTAPSSPAPPAPAPLQTPHPAPAPTRPAPTPQAPAQKQTGARPAQARAPSPGPDPTATRPAPTPQAPAPKAPAPKATGPRPSPSTTQAPTQASTQPGVAPTLDGEPPAPQHAPRAQATPKRTTTPASGSSRYIGKQEPAQTGRIAVHPSPSSLKRTDSFEKPNVDELLKQQAKRDVAPIPTRETTPQPILNTVDADNLLPKPPSPAPTTSPAKPEKKELDLDSLFSDLDTKQKNPTKPSPTPAAFDDLDIDALFQDFEGKVSEKPK